MGARTRSLCPCDDRGEEGVDTRMNVKSLEVKRKLFSPEYKVIPRRNVREEETQGRDSKNLRPSVSFAKTAPPPGGKRR